MSFIAIITLFAIIVRVIMSEEKKNNGVQDKADYFDLSTEKVELSDKGNAAKIRISTNMKWEIKG